MPEFKDLKGPGISMIEFKHFQGFLKHAVNHDILFPVSSMKACLYTSVYTVVVPGWKEYNDLG